MRKNVLLSVFIFIIYVASAQQDSVGQRNLTFKFPLSHLNGDIYAHSAGIGIGIEKMLKPRLSFSQEVGYIFDVDRKSIIGSNVSNLNGIKLVSELRKYLIRNEVPESGFFTSLELRNVITSSEQNEWFDGRVENNQIFRYRSGLSGNFGVLFYWDQHKRGRLTLELMGGAGIGYVYADSEKANSGNRDYNNDNRFFPWFNMDMKIGYIIR